MYLEFTSNVELREYNTASGEIDNRFQFIYASQLYETLFAVYARFNCEKQGEGKMKIKSLNFVLINYKGEKQLKIVEEWEEPKFKPTEIQVGLKPDGTPILKTINALTLEFWVQADTGRETLINEGQPLGMGVASEEDAGLVDINSKIVTLDFNEWQWPDKIVSSGEYFNLNRNLKAMEGDSSLPIRARAIVNGHFDSEFYYRDGIYIKPKMEDGDQINYDEPEFRTVSTILNTKIGDLPMMLPSVRCTPGSSQIIVQG